MRAPRYCATSEPQRVDRGCERTLDRQRLPLQLGGNELRRERRPNEPARAVSEGAVDASGDLPDHGQPIRRHGAEGDAAVDRCAHLDAEDRAQALEIAGMVLLAHRALRILQVVSRADDAQAIDGGHR